ncbi:hypothetical protein [Nostoc sp.]
MNEDNELTEKLNNMLTESADQESVITADCNKREVQIIVRAQQCSLVST